MLHFSKSDEETHSNIIYILDVLRVSIFSFLGEQMLINSWREKQFVTRCSRWFRREKPLQNEISWCDFNRALAHISGWLNLITCAAGLCCACSERQQMLWMSCGTQMLRPHTGRQDLLKTLPRCSEISVSMGHCSGKHRRTCGWELIPDPTTTLHYTTLWPNG